MVLSEYSIIFLSLTSFAPLIQDANLFFISFIQLLYSHTRRENNKFAHSLTKYSVNVQDCVRWMENIISQLYSILKNNH